MLVSLPKRIPSRQGQLTQYGPKLSNLMFYDLFSENFIEIVWCDGAQCIDKSNVSQFSKNNLLLGIIDPVLPQITQLILTALEIFWNILP